jgi:CRP-like cAMP-binding protein
VKSANRKKTTFSTPESPSVSGAFIVKGLFRRYAIDKDGNEATYNFMYDEGYRFFSSYSAIISNKLEAAYIQALEESELLVISRDRLFNYWKSTEEWKICLQIMTEHVFINSRERENELLMYDAGERYERFMEKHATCADRIKLSYVASYLGISPVSLSRIRRFCKKSSELTFVNYKT